MVAHLELPANLGFVDVAKCYASALPLFGQGGNELLIEGGAAGQPKRITRTILQRRGPLYFQQQCFEGGRIQGLGGGD